MVRLVPRYPETQRLIAEMVLEQACRTVMADLIPTLIAKRASDPTAYVMLTYRRRAAIREEYCRLTAILASPSRA